MLSLIPKVEYACENKTPNVFFTIPLIYLEYYARTSNFINGTNCQYIPYKSLKTTFPISILLN